MARVDHERIRAVVIGAGAMANRVHYPALASFADVEIVAICDLDPQRLHTTADRYNISRRYTDYRRMIEETAPDAVYAIGQPHIMYDIWRWCLEQGLNLYIEKPFGITIHQAESLAYLAEKHGCITQVSFQRRACPMVVMLREACLARGPITHAVCRFYKWEIRPYLEARDRLTDDGIHAVDTLRWMCGGEVTAVHSVSRRILTPDRNFFAALLEFDTGATGLLVTNWTSGRRIFAVEMHAPGICVEAEHEGKGYLYADGNLEPRVYDTREVAGSEEFYVYGGFAAKHREFLDCLKAGRRPSSHLGDALKTMRVVEHMLAQALLKGD